MFFEDQSYIDALSRNVQWMIFRVIVPFSFALFGASLLAKVKRGAMIYRTALFMPFILPSIVTADNLALSLQPPIWFAHAGRL